jgi:hypothetical protein
MAYQARLSDYVRGGVVVDASMQEGVPVTVAQSGVFNDLPGLTAATVGQVNQVFILFKGPDDFARPTDSRMYTARNLAQTSPYSGYGDPIDTRTVYNVGKSTLWNPTLVSGEKGLAMRGGTYAVPSGTFIDGASIRVPGALVKVGAGNKWDVTSSQTDAVGMVEEYNTTNSVLVFTLWH